MNKAGVLIYAASRCCSDGAQSEICGKPPNPCKNKEQYDGTALWTDDVNNKMTCNDGLQSLPTKPEECAAPVEGSDMNKAGVLTYAASRCCSGGDKDDICEAGNPCKTE